MMTKRGLTEDSGGGADAWMTVGGRRERVADRGTTSMVVSEQADKGIWRVISLIPTHFPVRLGRMVFLMANSTL